MQIKKIWKDFWMEVIKLHYANWLSARTTATISTCGNQIFVGVFLFTAPAFTHRLAIWILHKAIWLHSFAALKRKLRIMKFVRSKKWPHRIRLLSFKFLSNGTLTIANTFIHPTLHVIFCICSAKFRQCSHTHTNGLVWFDYSLISSQFHPIFGQFKLFHRTFAFNVIYFIAYSLSHSLLSLRVFSYSWLAKRLTAILMLCVRWKLAYGLV